jgi:AcrR family transcriptional regulator
MTTRPFHHGNLRAVLLEQAEVMLRDGGVDEVSLRELARQAGVSHGAPRSHFIDRQALLDALAVQGFDRLTHRVIAASATRDALTERFLDVGRAYVDFAIEDAALMELMFAAKLSSRAGPVQEAAARLFDALSRMLSDESSGDPADEDARTRFKLLFAATMQGTASLVVAQRISREQGAVLVDDAIGLLLESKLGARVLSR